MTTYAPWKAAAIAGALALGLPGTPAKAEPATQAEAGAPEEAYPWRFEEPAPGVLVALQPEKRQFDDSNAVLLIGPDDVLVVDAQSHAGSVRDLIRARARRTPKPVRFVVNTHWHADHTQGNVIYRESFGPEVSFIGHESLREDLPARPRSALDEQLGRTEKAIEDALERLAQGVDRQGQPLSDEQRRARAAEIERAQDWVGEQRDARFLPPDLTFRDRLTLHRGQQVVELRHLPGHTRGDTVVVLPKEGILITGDLLDLLPYVGHGDPQTWIKSLEALKRLDLRLIIPGHGPLFRGPDQLHRILSFLEALVGRVQEARAKGQGLEEIQSSLKTEDLREALAGDDEAKQRFFDAVLADAIGAAYRSLDAALEPPPADDKAASSSS